MKIDTTDPAILAHPSIRESDTVAGLQARSKVGRKPRRIAASATNALI
jgi:hypothetical protein